MITSTSNSQIKNLVQLQTKSSARKKSGLFVVEGIRIFKEIPKNLLQEVYVSESFSKTDDFNLVVNEGTKYEIVNDIVFKQASDTVNPQGILAIVKQPHMNNIEINRNDKVTILILDSIRDPGNMGTIIRTAEGAGVDAIVMNKECVDIYNPKVTRSTMGSIFRVHIVIAEDLCAAIDDMKSDNVMMYAAHLKGIEYDECEGFKDSVGIMIGNEANGLSEEVASKADRLIKIPMSGNLESLNAAVSAAILMYQARQAKKMGKLDK